jgi:hypothetical protein
MEDLLINHRICPQPQYWNHIWKIISSATNEKVSVPLILAAWWTTSDNEKCDRFKYHLDVAERLNIIDEVKNYLSSINEIDWHHKGE